MMKRTRRRGQAIVEFALSATLIFFMLCAAIDLGMIFFAVQGLRNAAQEGATYGSRWLVFDGSGRRVLDIDTIRNKVRTESGTGNRMGFVNLLDLNGDGINDANQSGVIASHIIVQMLSDSPDYDGNPLNNGTAPNYTPCTNAATAGPSECYIYITVSNDHKLIFPLSPVFTDTVKITSSYVLPIRDSYAQGSGTAPTPVPDVQPSPTPNVPKLQVSASVPQSISSKSGFSSVSVTLDNQTGSSIANVTFAIYDARGNLVVGPYSDTTGNANGTGYCMYGNGSCSSMSNSDWNKLSSGGYTLKVTATTQNGTTSSVSVAFAVT